MSVVFELGVFCGVSAKFDLIRIPRKLIVHFSNRVVIEKLQHGVTGVRNTCTTASVSGFTSIVVSVFVHDCQIVIPFCDRCRLDS